MEPRKKDSNQAGWRISSFLLLALLFAPGWMLTAEEDHATARRLRESGDILPLEQVLSSIRKDYPGRVLEVELESKQGRLIYEIEILDTKGVVHELYVDARTAQILRSKIDD